MYRNVNLFEIKVVLLEFKAAADSSDQKKRQSKDLKTYLTIA